VKFLNNYIGGGWGKDAKEGKYVIPAYVIQGTDISEVRRNNIDNCPLRYHTESNFRSRRIKEGDIIFEVSGGSKDQPVGRSLLINGNILQSFDESVICASFCKLIRVNHQFILPELFYLKLLLIYKDRSICKYQVQSTGISNFKFAYFLDNERVLLPPRKLQERFAKIIRPLFDLIALTGLKNSKLRKSRDILLPKLISGEIDVSGLDIKIRE